jgi:hypothetical protein
VLWYAARHKEDGPLATITTAPAAPRRPHVRLFYVALSIAMALVVFAGFAPTYYLRALNPSPVTISGSTSLSPLVHLHGAIFSAWVVLFIVQTTLVSQRNVRAHRRLGVAGAVVAAAMVVVGVNTAIASAAAGGAPPGVDPLAFLAVPLFDMVLFPIFVGLALWKRRDRESHGRLMLLAYMTVIVAAVARLPGVLPYGPPMFFGLTLLFLLAGVLHDRASRGRVHPVYVWGGAVFVLSVPVRLAVSTTDAWRQFALFLTR